MRLIRTLAGLTASALLLTACGTPGDTSAGATPQFVTPAASPAPSSEIPPPALPSSAAASSRSVTPSKSATTTNADVKYVFPVKASNVSFHTTHSKYPATDIFADCGETVVATTSGVVLEVSLKDVYVEGAADGPNNGGLSVSLLGDDGVRYYGSHLSKVLTNIRAGVRVTAGQQLGKVGHTGNASGVCHLHYGISPPCAKVGDWKVRRGVVWPHTFLTSWRKSGQKSPVATVQAWKTSHNCKA
ncbi:M23 family metallopeptidase [Actinoplanes sp. NPDC026619]|uniref:M23 family metallopeptidase n=1 Tax=Actinoplanes sp. NPDC026619 TaxID=3155798 RepID=UPI00340F8D79